jgi:hypothetical protein
MMLQTGTQAKQEPKYGNGLGTMAQPDMISLET